MSSVRCKRLLTLLTGGVLVFCLVTVAPVTTAAAKTVAEYQSELDAAKAKANTVKSKIANLKAQNAPYEQQLAALQEQIDAVQAEIDLFEAQINQCKATIEERTTQLADSKELLRQRLVTMYTSGNSRLSILLSASDYGDYLAKTELTASVSRHDTEMITGILDAISELELAQEQLAASENEILVKKSELVATYAEVNEVVTAYNKQVSALNSELVDIQKEEAEIQAAIKKAQTQQITSSSGAKVGTGQFIWPLPGCYKISSGYGTRWGRLHSGIDIISASEGVLGKTIIAADSGTVILSKYYSGYGNCIMIDHGNGYVTLYGHMRYLSSYGVGATVEKGTAIGYVGSTGNSTGPHLHFEIRKNGSTTNPLNYYN